MLHPIATELGQHNTLIGLIYLDLFDPQLYGAQERTLTSKSSIGHHSGRIATAVRAMPGASKKSPASSGGRAKVTQERRCFTPHQLSSVRRTYRRWIFGEGIRRQTRRNGYHLREIWSRLPSGSCRKVHDLSTTRPLSGWDGSALIQLGSFAQAVWLPCPETQAAVCCRAAAFGTPKHQQRSIIFRQACQGANLV